MKSDLAYPGDNRGDAVSEISIQDDHCVVRGRTGAMLEGRARQAGHGQVFLPEKKGTVFYSCEVLIHTLYIYIYIHIFPHVYSSHAPKSSVTVLLSRILQKTLCLFAHLYTLIIHVRIYL